MKTKTILSAIMMASLAIMIFSCKPQSDISGNYKFETECIGVELDGSQTLKVWGNGRTRADAIEQAKKNGVRDVLFKGIRNGTSDCNVKPVLSEVNIQEKNEDYFFKFFTDGGPYKEFISLRPGKGITTNEVVYKSTSGGTQYYGVIIRVLRADLKARMIQDNILKP